MTTDSVGIRDNTLIPDEAGSAGVTRRLLWRTGLGYLVVVVIGVLPWLLGLDVFWQASGLGLVFPGAGFIAAGGWGTLLLVPSVILAGLAGIAWFGSGMVVALPGVWLLSAVGAGLLADEVTNTRAIIVIAIAVVVAVVAKVILRQRDARRTRKRTARNEVLPRRLAEVERIHRNALEGTGSRSELSPEQLAALRYSIDLAMQDLDDWSGFNRIDIFQTSALRYQINQAGWGIAVAQSAYLPGFQGYLSLAQRRLIDRYLQPAVLSYWKWERLWGHLRYSADPVGRDNIMLTGYIGLNLALYMGNTGDHRYLGEATLNFPVSKRRSYAHSALDVRDSLLTNYRHYDESLCLYPCEPNWVYTACNFRGAATLMAYDRMLGTDHWPRIRGRYVDRLTTEFMTGDGSVVALRSSLTGLPVPFPMPDSILSKELNPIDQDLAHRYWALTRDEALRWTDSGIEISIPGRNVDFGNYTVSDIFAIGSLYGSAQEMGDAEVAEAAMAKMVEVGTLSAGPSRYFDGSSTIFNTTLVMDRLLRPNGWHDALTTAPKPGVQSGPALLDVSYPDVLVARAVTDGTDLELVLRPGAAPGPQNLRVGRLRPGEAYRVTGSSVGEIHADASGEATVPVELRDRLEVTLAPSM